MTISIPKLIMQTWKTKEVPDKWKTSPESIKKYMPSWRYILMDDDMNREFVKRHFPDFLRYYDQFEYAIQRADAIRYMWLYVNGGIYIDLDIELLKPLDEFFYSTTSNSTSNSTSTSSVYLVKSGNISSCITNSFMASTPKCQLWLDCIEQMKQPYPWWAYGKHLKVMNSTGPMMINYVVKKFAHPYQELPNKKIFPCSVCDHFELCRFPDAYAKPLAGSSWISYDTSVYIFFFCHWQRLLFILFIIFLVLFIYYFLHHR